MIYRVCEPTISRKEAVYVTDAIKRGEISGKGDYVERFERVFSRLVGKKHGIAVNSGSTAILGALQAIGVGIGDEIICPTFTMAAPALAVQLLGAQCIWVDCREDGNINPKLIEKKITHLTKAILVVHVYGIPVDKEVYRIARKHGLYIIEDAAEAHGADVGHGDITCYSFYANKIITTGEGGMCLTNRKILAEKLRRLRNYSQSDWYIHEEISLNYRLSSVLAAIGLAQCELFHSFVKKRNLIATWYDKYLKHTKIELRNRPKGSVNWMYGILVDDRDRMMKRLEKQGIESRPFFVPMHLQPFNKNWGSGDSYPVSERLSKRGLYLPSSSYLIEKDIKRISQCVFKAT